MADANDVARDRAWLAANPHVAENYPRVCEALGLEPWTPEARGDRMTVANELGSGATDAKSQGGGVGRTPPSSGETGAPQSSVAWAHRRCAYCGWPIYHHDTATTCPAHRDLLALDPVYQLRDLPAKKGTASR